MQVYFSSTTIRSDYNSKYIVVNLLTVVVYPTHYPLLSSLDGMSLSFCHHTNECINIHNVLTENVNRHSICLSIYGVPLAMNLKIPAVI